ncbi:MAG: hypothetical protein II304_06030 [Bacteroidales bacterium]|nr:hypothetical protein [Bacteroidales bacterium]
MNTSSVILLFCIFLIPGLVLVGLHHLVAFILERAYCSSKVSSFGIIRALRDASIMGFAEEWWQHLWYWTSFAIRGIVCIIGLTFSMCVVYYAIDASNFIKHNQEIVAEYDAIERPTLSDIIYACDYNERYAMAHLLATEEVGKNLKKIDEERMLSKLKENLNVEKD